ncbi:flagellar motor protein MotB [Alicyclobacillus ferrooxydans]|uniref:OmpA-like domain-containing protein n=1 Tax=Alicyclobacillus ferrooxydans TaxID=471514 RepID=A0A0P9GTB6_9BACL|nr:flagellar motor protein MotB [Alicyclobacillus ferrooxydans]KPV44401.1 hypothetical protein AN477_07165 [Alicyclobacillus ferrooxydans]
MKRRRSEDEHVNQERWLITYSDLITLLLIFFVILFSMSTIDKQKFQQLMMTMAKSMSVGQSHIVMNQGNTGLIAQSNQLSQAQKIQEQKDAIDAKQLDRLYKEVQSYIKQNHLQNNMSVTNENIGVVVTMKDVALFATGSDQLTPQSRHILDGLVPLLLQMTNDIDVAGYTDNVPIHTAQFASNWELSAMRAINVVHYLISKNIDPSRLAGIGYGAYHPVASNATPLGRQSNRRVNLVVLRKSDANLFNSPAPSTAKQEIGNQIGTTLSGNINNTP